MTGLILAAAISGVLASSADTVKDQAPVWAMLGLIAVLCWLTGCATCLCNRKQTAAEIIVSPVHLL